MVFNMKKLVIVSLMFLLCSVMVKSVSGSDYKTYQEITFEHKGAILYLNTNDGLTVLEDEKHALYYLNSNIVMMARALEFIQQHLK